MIFISVAEAVNKWKLCKENRIEGAIYFNRVWVVPKDAQKPVDGRLKKIQEIKHDE